MFRRTIFIKALKLVGLAFCLLGAAQVMVNEIECEGLITVADHTSGCESDQDASSSDCCHVCTSQYALVLEPSGSALPVSTELSGYLIKEDAIPDGPVRAIDHPPQLS